MAVADNTAPPRACGTSHTSATDFATLASGKGSAPADPPCVRGLKFVHIETILSPVKPCEVIDGERG